MKPSGVMVALATPVDGQGGVDRQGLDNLVKRVLAGGVRGICPLGTSGEGPSLRWSERVEVVDAVRAAAPEDTPIIPGIFAENPAEAAAQAEAYAARGAAAVLVAPPHYYVLGADVGRFFAAVAEVSPLPVVMYHIPAFTKNPVPPAVVAEMASHPNVVGLKDSSRDMEYLLGVGDAIAAAGVSAEDFTVMTGTDTMLLAALGAGAGGAIVASANLVPEMASGIYDLWEQGRTAEAARLEGRLRQVVAACRAGSFPAGWKAALASVGVCGPALVPPRTQLPSGDAAVLAGRLAELGVTGA